MTANDDDSKVKVLRQLARTPGEVTTSALEREVRKVLEVLESDSHYEILRRQIELLDVFAFRVADVAVSGIARFLSRLKTLELAHDGDAWIFKKYETPERLVVASLELLSRLRYFRTREILAIAFDIATSTQDPDIEKSSQEVLERIAKFDIDVFYSGEGRAGLGPTPQQIVLDFLENEVDHHTASGHAAQLCVYLLSPNMSGTSWDYQSVTWKRGAIPAAPAIADIRQRAISLLKKMYGLASSVEAKKRLINALFEAARLPDHGETAGDLKTMISTNAVEVLTFLSDRLPGEPFPIVQKIEHDAYWRFYHAPTEAVRRAALEVEASIAALDEYRIYRDLIGFEGIFQKWEERSLHKTDFQGLEAYRSGKASEYAASVNDANWHLWRDRILAFCETESNDLATFPRFYDFLEKLARHQPKLALGLLRENPPQIAGFTIPLLRGLWAGPLRAEVKNVIWGWISRGENLVGVTKLFWSNDQVDDDVLSFLFQRLLELEDYPVLGLLMAAAASNYAKFPHLIGSIMLPSIEVLSQAENSDWINQLWFGSETRQWLAELDAVGRQIVLDGLVPVPRLDYHAEEILAPIAEKDIAQAVQFFRKRIAMEDAKPEGSEYDAIPYSFHQLHSILATEPRIVVEIVRSWFREPIELFQYRGGLFLKAIFPTFAATFADELMQLIRNGEREDLEFVLEILRNYDGQPFLFAVCREILARLSPDDEELLNELRVVLASTGVVHGEFGFSNAYQEKSVALTPWLSDPDVKVRNFTEGFIEELRKSAVSERRRASEEIALRKHRYGVREEGSSEEQDLGG